MSEIWRSNKGPNSLKKKTKYFDNFKEEGKSLFLW